MSPRERAAHPAGNGDVGWQDDILSKLSHLPATEFLGYDTLESEAKILAIVDTRESMNWPSRARRFLPSRQNPFPTPLKAVVGSRGDRSTILTPEFEFKSHRLHRCPQPTWSESLREYCSRCNNGNSGFTFLPYGWRPVTIPPPTCSSPEGSPGTHVEQAGNHLGVDTRLRFDCISAMTDAEIAGSLKNGSMTGSS